MKIRQEINIIDRVAGGASGIVLGADGYVTLDARKYNGTVTFYFECVVGTSAASSTLTLRRFGGTVDDATINTTSTGRLRSSNFTPPVGQASSTRYGIFSANTSIRINAARIIVIENATDIVNTQTQIEIGNAETSKTNTSSSALTNPKYWKYTAANWDGTKTFYAEATYKKSGVANPSFISAGAIADDLTGAASFTPTPPTHQAKDILLAVAWNTGGSKPSTATAGWAEIAFVDGTGAITWWWKRAAAAGTAGPTITAADTDCFGLVYVIRGCISSGTPFEDATTSGDGSTTDTTPDTALITTTHINTLVASFLGRDDDAGYASGNPPVGWTAADNTTTTDGTDAGFSVITKVVAVAGDVAAVVFGTLSVGRLYGALTLAFIPSEITVTLQEDNGSFGSWADIKTIITTPSITLTLTRSSSFAPTDGRNYRLAALISDSADSYDIYNAKIIVDQVGAQENIAVSGGVYNIGGGTASSGEVYQRQAQDFKCPTNFTLKGIELSLSKDASPVDNLNVDIVSTLDGTSLANASIAGTGLTTSEAYYTFTFGSQINITANTTYYIQLSRSGARDTVNDYKWYRVTSDVYADGSNWSRTNNSWTADTTSDQIFRLLGSTAITLLEPQYLILNTADVGTGLQSYNTLFDVTEWNDTNNVYKHAQDATNAADNTKLTDITPAPDVDMTSSSVTGANQQISSVITNMPSTADEIDSNVITSTGVVGASRILVINSVSLSAPIFPPISQPYISSDIVSV